MEGFQGFSSPIDPYLDPGERLLWNGQPKRGIRLQWNDLIMIPFSMVWCGFAVFWEATVLGLVKLNPHQNQNQHPPLFMAVFGLPFVAIGLYMVVGRFFSDAASRKRTWYGVTDKRLIILKTFMGTKVISFDYANLQNLNLVERGDRSGDIVFGLPFPIMAGADVRVRRSTGLPGFYQVADAREVFSRIQAAQRQAKS